MTEPISFQTEKIKHNISDNIMFLCSLNGISKRQLAHRLNVPETSMRRICSGKYSNLPIVTLLKICSTFSIELPEIISQALKDTEIYKKYSLTEGE